MQASRMSSYSLSAAVKAAIKPQPPCSTTYEGLRVLWGLYWDSRRVFLGFQRCELHPENPESLRIKKAIEDVTKALALNV